MPDSIDHISFGNQRPLNRVLVFGLVVSLLVLSISIGWRSLSDRLDRKAMESVQKALQAEQELLSARFARLDSQDTAARLALQDRISYLNDETVSADQRAGQPPFEVEDFMPSIVELFCLDNNDQEVYYTASGTVIDSAGYVLTNRHSLTSADGSYIRYCGIGFTVDQRQAPKPEFLAVTLAVHRQEDLAVLKITERLDSQPLPDEFESLAVAGQSEVSDGLKLGDTVFIGGYPGLGAETFTFTQGVVSGRVGDGLIKTSALIDKGTSGGAAFDANGSFIGVPTAAVQGKIGGSLGYLIGADVVDDFLKDFYAHDLPQVLPLGDSPESD